MPFFDARHFAEELRGDERPHATLKALGYPDVTVAAIAQAIVADAVRMIPLAATVAVTLDNGGAPFHAEHRMSAPAPDADCLDLPITISGERAGSITIGGRTAGPFRLVDRYAAQLLAALATVGVTQSRLAATERFASVVDRRFHATFTFAPTGIAHVAVDGRFIRINDQFCEIVGHSREYLLNVGFQGITHPDDLEGDVAQIRRLVEARGGRYMMEKRYIRPDGSAVWVNLNVALVTDANGDPEFFVSVIEDLSKLKQAHFEATHDSLTGLLNRRGLSAEVEREIARGARAGSPLATIYLDLDNFKQINDRFGHLAGDSCLIAVAQALTAATRPTDLVARIGGDEFVLFLPGASLDDARNAVDRMRRALERIGGDDGRRICGSFGLTSAVPTMGASPGDLIARADEAMFLAKRGGKDRVGLYGESVSAAAR